jgi:hypothetical protein
MSGQTVGNIIYTTARSFDLILLAEFNNRHALCVVEKWQRVLNGPPCLTYILTFDDDVVPRKRFDRRRHH